MGLGLFEVGSLHKVKHLNGFFGPARLGLSTPLDCEQALGTIGKRVIEECLEPNNPKQKMLMLYDEQGLSRVLATPGVFAANSSLPLKVKQVTLPRRDENPTIQQLKSRVRRNSGKKF